MFEIISQLELELKQWAKTLNNSLYFKITFIEIYSVSMKNQWFKGIVKVFKLMITGHPVSSVDRRLL